MANQPVSAELAVVLHALTDWLAHSRVEYSFIGGVAVSLLTQPRFTQDADLMAWLTLDECENFLAQGQAFGFVSRSADQMAFARARRVLIVQHQLTQINVDISLAALPFEEEMIKRATTVRPAEFELRLPTPEDLLISKVFASRPKDLIDAASVLTTYPDLDRTRVRNWVQSFAEFLERPEMSNWLEGLFKQIPPTTKSPKSREKK